MKTIERFWSYEAGTLIRLTDSSIIGLSSQQAELRLNEQGTAKQNQSLLVRELVMLLRQYSNPLILLLIFAAALSGLLKEYSDSIIIVAVLVMMGIFSYIQRRFANRAIEKLQKQVRTRATVIRDSRAKDVNTDEVVQGDIMLLNAGDIVSADGLILESNDLHVNESSLTGESFPVEKEAGVVPSDAPVSKARNSVFKGTSVVNGTARVIVIHTSQHSELGRISQSLSLPEPRSAFEKGITKFGNMILYVTLAVCTVILIMNIVLDKPVLNSLLFSLAISVGLAPELLPAILTVTMAAGAKKMAAKNVIIKQLNAIQNLGQMDMLCCDKTGTITEGTVTINQWIDYDGKHCENLRRLAFINAFYESGFNNPIDESIRQCEGIDISDTVKTDEVPYDFVRKRLSVVIEQGARHVMITKGALNNILDICSNAQNSNHAMLPIEEVRPAIERLSAENNSQGFRCIGVCIKDVTDDPVIDKNDECNMTFIGLIILEDPLKEGIGKSVNAFRDKGIRFKLITGDNMIVAKHIAGEIGMDNNRIIYGHQLRGISSDGMRPIVNNFDLFAETEPSQKEAIVKALQANGHTVGFLGDGINDAPALKAADVGISVNTAVDIARESASVVLLTKSLDALLDGIVEGRKTFINTQKYIFLTISANFGNMLSIAVFSVTLPFLPLLPTQILLNNFLSDIPTLALARDRVDDTLIRQPGSWNIRDIRRFMMVYGLQSSVFDFATFLILIYLFRVGAEKFRTAWFLESLLTEVVIIFVIRTKRNLLRSDPPMYLLMLCILVITVAIILPYSSAASSLGFLPLPLSVTVLIVVVTLFYGLTSEILKKRYLPL